MVSDRSVLALLVVGSSPHRLGRVFRRVRVPDRRLGVSHRQNVAVDVIVLLPRAPIRAFVLAAFGAVLGAVLSVVADMVAWGIVLRIAGLVLMALSVLLLIAVIVARVRNRVRIEVDDEGFRVKGPHGTQSGAWDDIVKVSQSMSGRRVTFHRRDGAVIHLVGQVEGVEMARLKTAVIARLDAHRGYGSGDD